MRFVRFVVFVILIVAGTVIGHELSLAFPFLSRKLVGQGPDCPWWNATRASRIALKFKQLQKAAYPAVREKVVDESLDIVLVASPEGDFWIRRSGEAYSGPQLLAYLLAEQQWMEELSPEAMVKPGDVVLDCGAHVGVFTHRALARGAGRVIAVEPDPVNLECLRRNFNHEAKAGKVIVVPKAVWNQEGSIALWESTQNSGQNSAVMPAEGASFTVPATTIDRLAVEYGRIDYIKMDIEGAEREALAGARETLRRFKPRLAIESYHLPDDGRVLPSVVRAANPDYSITVGPCCIMHDMAVPYVFYGR